MVVVGLVLALVALIPLGGPFVEASATADRVADTIEVELVVEVDQSANAVVAHLVLGGDEEQRSISLDLRAGGQFAGFITMPIQEAVIVFELLGPGGSVLSAPTTLSELGIDFAAFGESVTPVGGEPAPDPVTPEARRWLWLAIAAGAAALSALAFWALGPKRTQESDDDVMEVESSVD